MRNRPRLEIAVLLLPIICSACGAAQSAHITELVGKLEQQTGGTMGYPYWDDSLLDHYPANEIVRCGSAATRAVAARLDDYSRTKAGHSGKMNYSTYSVSDVACFILVAIGTKDAIALVEAERDKRKGWTGPGAQHRYHPPGAVWALRYRHGLGRRQRRRPNQRME